jgi:glycosyltransferase involved in cell wall biosynthesis
VYLWAGFIQQIRDQDFRVAHRVATQALTRGLEATFVFAFKPETYRPEYGAMARRESGIHVLATDPLQFAALRRAADVFFSPVVGKDTIIGPPLTWIEMMGLGRPIVTTAVPGAEELVEHDKTGYVARDENGLVDGLFDLHDRFASMRDACRETVRARYNLLDIRDRYVRLWRGRAR